MAFKINVKILCNILLKLVDYQKRYKNTSLILTSIPILTHFKINKSKSSKEYCDTLKPTKLFFRRSKRPLSVNLRQAAQNPVKETIPQHRLRKQLFLQRSDWEWYYNNTAVTTTMEDNFPLPCPR